mgnify:CR=1 FL=1
MIFVKLTFSSGLFTKVPHPPQKKGWGTLVNKKRGASPVTRSTY